MEIVELLVLNGADVNAKMKDGHTALTLACEKVTTGLFLSYVSIYLKLNCRIDRPAYVSSAAGWVISMFSLFSHCQHYIQCMSCPF